MADKRRVLVVDDERQHCENMHEILSLRDYDVTIATCGREALSIIKESFFPVILLDVKMPDVDGETVLKEAVKAHPKSRVIMVTGHSEEDSRSRFIGFGAFEYIVKPLEFDKFFPMLETLFC